MRRKGTCIEYRFSIDGTRYSVCGATSQECRDKEYDLRKEIEAGTYKKTKRPSAYKMEVYIDNWLELKKNKNKLKPSTLRTYRKLINRICRQVINESGTKFGELKLGKVAADDIENLQSSLLSDGLQSRTVNDSIYLLKQVFDSAVNRQEITWNPINAVEPVGRTEPAARDTIHRSLTREEAEKFLEQYAYYTVAIGSPQRIENCPLLNEQGEVIGLVQPSANAQDSLSYAISVVFADSLRMTGFSMNEPFYQQTQIKKELPDDLKEANIAIFLASSKNDSLAYARLIDDMISKFPTSPDGYTYKAQLQTSSGDFASADRNMNEAVRLSDPKDDAHFNFARLIYAKETYQSEAPFEGWSLDKALSEIREAIAINPLPSYQQLEAPRKNMPKPATSICSSLSHPCATLSFSSALPSARRSCVTPRRCSPCLTVVSTPSPSPISRRPPPTFGSVPRLVAKPADTVMPSPT